MSRKKGKFEQPRTAPVERPAETAPPKAEPSRTSRDSWETQTVRLPNDMWDAETVQLPRDTWEADPAWKREPARPSEAAREPEPVRQPTRPYGTNPPQPPAEKGRRLSSAAIAGIAAVALVLALLIGIFAYGLILKNGNTIYPNIYVAGINVGGMTRQEATEAVAGVAEVSYASAALDVRLPDRTLSFRPEQTNVALDADEVIDEALAYGRSGSVFSALSSYLSCRRTERYIPLQTTLNLDTDYIRSMIDQVAAEVEQSPQPSRVEYNESRGTLTVQVGYPERTLDADGLFDAVYNAFMNSDFTPLTWEYNEVPCELVDLTPYYEEYCTEVKDAAYDEETHIISEEVSGFGFDLEAANQRLATAAAGSEVVIQLEDIEPEVTKEELEHEMFGVKLYEAESSYNASQTARTENLRLACQAINGTVLNPDEVFSFNDVVGERTEAKGYLPATVYVGGGASAEELGGGVCQVASTIYLATLYLDLEQVYREPHMYAVTYVPYGMDATVYWGSVDYKFRNTLDYPIKIQADISGGTVNITFWGAEKLDFTVEMSYTILETYPWTTVEEVDETKPVGYRELAESPYTGYKVVTYKTIYGSDGKQLSNELEATSTYKKRDQKYIVGPTEETTEEPEEPTDPEEPENPIDPMEPIDPGDDYWP